VGVKGGRRDNLAASYEPTVYSLNVSRPYGPPRAPSGIALPFYLTTKVNSPFNVIIAIFCFDLLYRRHIFFEAEGFEVIKNIGIY
jgi:hypothetical protein